MNTFPPFMVFSAELANLTAAENESRTQMLAGALRNRGIEYVSALGRYRGIPEHSFLVFAYEGDAISETVESLARLYGQSTILYVDAQRLAYLSNLQTFESVELGKWAEIPAFAAKERDHTQVNGRFYAIN